MSEQDWLSDVAFNFIRQDIHLGFRNVIPTPQSRFALGLPSDLLRPTTIIPHPKNMFCMIE